MSDLIVVATIVAFFGVCVVLVRACDRIIGPEEQVTPSVPESERLAA